MGSWMEDSSCTDWSQFRMVKYNHLQLCVFILVGLLCLICLIQFSDEVEDECKRDIFYAYRYRRVIKFYVSNIDLDESNLN